MKNIVLLILIIVMNKRLFLKSLAILLAVNTPFVHKIFKKPASKILVKNNKSNLFWILDTKSDF